MTTGVAESWARLRLVQGDSSAQVWELVASRGQTTLTVGCGPTSAWVIREQGVRPLHFSLHWDGTTLRIADTYGAGDVRADGTPVTAQWRPLAGRVRIEFGKAAMVAETSGAVAHDLAHPLEPSPLPPMVSSGSEPVSSQRLHKATLLGVSPVSMSSPQMGGPIMGGAAAGSAGEQTNTREGSSPPPDESFRPARPTDSDRARKATLLGIAMSDMPMAPQEASPPSTPEKTPGRGIPSGTLIGVASSEVKVQRFAHVSGEEPAAGVAKVPLAELRVGGGPVAPTKLDADGVGAAVTQVEVRPIAGAADPAARSIGSTWQEIPTEERVPPAVLINPAQSAPPREGVDAEQPVLRPSLDGYERYSDVPTQMRDVAGLESRRPRRAFPWRYVGIAALTAAAYFAWLYLLDHL